MYGDFSRILFDPNKFYSSVKEQQGRLRVDADGNENTDILLTDSRDGRVAMMGHHGAPEHDAGMAITSNGSSLLISSGCYYVDGIRCELRSKNGSPIPFAQQPFLPEAALPQASGLYVVYLDVWERALSAIQDPATREVAIGGPDTTIRTQVIAQVKLLRVTGNQLNANCETSFVEWDRLVGRSTGTLEVRVAQAGTSTDPCIVPESAGFRGLENQLYRFQIHGGNFSPTSPGGTDVAILPTFKWSHDNGSFVATWREHPATLELIVDRLGPGGASGFAIGNWIELTDDHDDLLERIGIIAQIDDIQADKLVLADPNGTVATALTPPPQNDANRHSQVRRWDSFGTRSTNAIVNDPDVTPDGWIRIEDGIEVRFSGGNFRSGDYWVVPARTATLPGTTDRQLEWPLDGIGNPVALRSQGPNHHYVRLALASFNGNTWTVLGDCRHVFPSLTELVQLDAIGGEGQHAPGDHWLPAPIVVGVSRGSVPIPQARVRFTIVPPQGGPPRGTLSPAAPNENGVAAATGTQFVVQTGSDGVARVWWRLGQGPAVEELGDTYQPLGAQEVEAVMLDHDGTPTHLFTRFVGQVSDLRVLIPAGGDGQIGHPGETLEIALRVRICEGQKPVHKARVEFVNLNRMLDGQNLNEFTGGAIHASANVVSFEPWPGGSRMVEAVVETDQDGVAQVQWILGSETGLPAQRVEAFLLDVQGNRTNQRTLFTAHLAIAKQIAWIPHKALAPYLNGAEDHNVQAALDALCEAHTQLKTFHGWTVQAVTTLRQVTNLTSQPGAPPFLFANVGGIGGVSDARGPARPLTSMLAEVQTPVQAIEWLRFDAQRHAIGTGSAIPIADVSAIEITPSFELPSGLVPGVPERMAVSVTIDVPVRPTGKKAATGHTPVRIDGEISFVQDRIRWVPTTDARAWLKQQVEHAGAPLRVEIVFRPAALNPSMRASTWSEAVWLTP